MPRVDHTVRKCPHGQWYCPWTVTGPCRSPKRADGCTSWHNAATALRSCGLPAIEPPRAVRLGQMELGL